MFEIDRAEQIVAFFAMQEADKKINIMKVIKLIYLADRKCIEKHGFPISDDDHVSMKHGPVCSKIYNRLKPNSENSTPNARRSPRKRFDKLLKERMENDISLMNQNLLADDLDELSDAEIAIMQEIWQKFGAMDQFELRNWTHQHIPEWQDPGRSSIPIELKTIMKYVGIQNVDEHHAQWVSLQEDIKKLASLS
ncbi:MAG: SocA family protein [Alphaproteobacteria bacterium]|nr:SocA family protein [Alphaproteobacteria bacterium]